MASYAPSIAATGMKSIEDLIAITSNNIANLNTPGFKKQVPSFQDLAYQIESRPGSSTSQQGSVTPAGVSIGLGSNIVSTSSLDLPGTLQETSKTYDLAISRTQTQRGYFRIQSPDDGKILYTRDGSFQLSQDGVLVNSQGFVVSPGITIPVTATSVNIDPNGIVYVQMSPNLSDPPNAVGQILLADFTNPAGLLPLGNNLYEATPASGAIVVGSPGTNQFGNLKQGFLELSNVVITDELMVLIRAQRCYEICAKVIKVWDETQEMATRSIST